MILRSFEGIFFPEEEEAFFDIISDIEGFEQVSIIGYMDSIKLPIPNAPDSVNLSTANTAQHVLADCANSSSLICNVQLDLIVLRSKWREAYIKSGRLFKLGIHNRSSSAKGKTKEARETDIEVQMGDICTLHYYIERQVEALDSLFEALKARMEQFDRVHKTVSRQVTILDMMMTHQTGGKL